MLDRIKEKINEIKFIKLSKENIHLIIENEDLWGTFTYVIIFFIILILSALNIYTIDDSVIYSFSLASVVLSISQIFKGTSSKILKLLGIMIIIVGLKIDIKYIETIKSFIGDNYILIVSMIVVFTSGLYGKIKELKTVDEIQKNMRVLQNVSEYENSKIIEKLEIIEECSKSITMTDDQKIDIITKYCLEIRKISEERELSSLIRAAESLIKKSL